MKLMLRMSDGKHNNNIVFFIKLTERTMYD